MSKTHGNHPINAVFSCSVLCLMSHRSIQQEFSQETIQIALGYRLMGLAIHSSDQSMLWHK